MLTVLYSVPSDLDVRGVCPAREDTARLVMPTRDLMSASEVKLFISKSERRLAYLSGCNGHTTFVDQVYDRPLPAVKVR